MDHKIIKGRAGVEFQTGIHRSGRIISDPHRVCFIQPDVLGAEHVEPEPGADHDQSDDQKPGGGSVVTDHRNQFTDKKDLSQGRER